MPVVTREDAVETVAVTMTLRMTMMRMMSAVLAAVRIVCMHSEDDMVRQCTHTHTSSHTTSMKMTKTRRITEQT